MSPRASRRSPAELKKHVILRVDRADGFVARNLLVRGALEHGIYIEEADGYRLERVKFFWAADYGNLTFTSDHGLYKNCDGFGSGDSVVYPGAAPETGSQATDFYPDAPRFNTVVKKCDMRGSALAYSGSMGNAVRITKNNVYGNGSGLSTDTISASGHPGFPADSVQIDHNLIYSNNLNLFVDDPPVEPVVGVPVGVGILWPGHNDGRVFDNWIFDNWRRGTMLLSIPDAIVGLTPEGSVDPGVSCPTAPSVTTSCNNHYYDNHMGQAPARLHQAGLERAAVRHPARRPRRSLAAQRGRLLVGRVVGQHRQLLVRQHRHRRDRGERHRPGRRLAARGPAVGLRHVERRRRRGEDRGAARLLDVGARPDGRRPPGLRLVLQPAGARDGRRPARAGAHRARARRTSCRPPRPSGCSERLAGYSSPDARRSPAPARLTRSSRVRRTCSARSRSGR